MTHSTKPLTADELAYTRGQASPCCLRLLATIDQQAKQLECGECGNPKGFAIFCADCWSHYYRSMSDVTSAAPSDETPTIAYWRRNAHEALDKVLDEQVAARLANAGETLAYLSAKSNSELMSQQVVNHIVNARLAAARSEKA